MRRADAGAGEHGHRGLGDHRQVDGHPVAALHAPGPERRGEPLNVIEEVGVRDRSGVARFALEVIGDAVTQPVGNVTIKAVRADVQLSVFEPLGKREPPIEDLGERLRPGHELTRLPGPERFPVSGCFIVETMVVQQRVCSERRRGRKRPVLDE